MGRRIVDAHMPFMDYTYLFHLFENLGQTRVSYHVGPKNIDPIGSSKRGSLHVSASFPSGQFGISNDKWCLWECIVQTSSRGFQDMTFHFWNVIKN